MLDIDDTDDPVHGQQELALFNAYYDCTCFQPIHIFDGLSGKPVLSLLRPGKRPSGKEVAKVLRHVIGRIRKHWPQVDILVRADSHYCSEPALALLEAFGCHYIVGFQINSSSLMLLDRRSWRAQCARNTLLIERALPRALEGGAGRASWSPASRRRHRATDVRFIVTNLEGAGRTLL